MIRPALVWLACFLLASPLSAQIQPGGNGAVLFERYNFESGLLYQDVSEFTVPLTVSIPIATRTIVTFSGGMTRVSLTGDPDMGLSDKELSGILDTEARLVVNLIPDRLSFLATGVVPTGTEALEVGEEAILSALSSPVIGYSATQVGGGGRAGAGLVGAVPVGEMALGIAGTYTHSMAYNPVVGSSTEWKPGGEIRVRAGLEGTVGPQTYLRVASILAMRQADQMDGLDRGEIGKQFHLYAALNQAMESSSLTVYAFDSYRSAPQIETTSIGAVQMPKGNLVALGAKLEVPVARETRLIPKAEFRKFSEAPRDGAGDGSMESAGSTFRVGADLKHPLNQTLALVVEANGLFGSVGDGAGGTVGVTGFRGGLHLEFRR